MIEDWVTGREHGVAFPAHPGALQCGDSRSLTAMSLTTMFRASGALGRHGEVVRVHRCDETSGGSTGRKLVLDVEYDAACASGLPSALFVKFSRDFDDPLRDRGRTQMDAEVRFAGLSSTPGFPIAVPRVLFADYDDATGTGILVTERITFDANGIEPHYPKCLDDEMPDPVGHYRALLTALGRLAGTARSGAMPDELVARFPVDLRAAALGEPMPLTADRLSRRISRLAEFVEAYPRLLPANVGNRRFVARMGSQAHEVMCQESAIWNHLATTTDYLALCHWNANVDNAWFWRGPDGALRCGLMDWGCVSQMNVAMAVWGCLSGAETATWDGHLDELLQLLVTEVAESGGPRLDPATLLSHLQLYVALMGVTWLLDVPALVRRRLPDTGPGVTPDDPRIRGDEGVRAPLLMLTNVLNLWETRPLDDALDALR
ncbi:hypothetical protein MMAD_05830 [Mycolicibacterium madagascariense]|uniref:Aminoglycoside phosphotransferase domain-containing protein n=1 Tax=Mycolicibacterium madagascariense TaxID=212765 RepID=A0A7I7XD16_9MYCO|nr:hypothetical protein [Mycolicibacterium madagascariense]MCV7011859.1 hypothetical protein [Mycolicibacterium madagascariense]BBZ26288.1 hypothetical protein MMAD_05830 [Mycolicibacterium madagascariense]